MSNYSRTYNSVLNSLFGIGASAITVTINFIVRIILVKELGEEIYGLNSLFQNITNVMLLMELGISSAMVIHLYEPVKTHNRGMIRAIMSFYKKVYLGVAIAFTIISLLIAIFFLDDLVTSSIQQRDVQMFFILFTSSFVVNYLTYYKRSILFAEQKNRISIGVTAICELAFRTIQILFLCIYHEYVIFLILLIAEKFVSNKICERYVNKYHPYLKNLKGVSLEKEKRNAIFNTIKPLVVNQTAGTVQQSASSIIISALLGSVSIVGYFGNYQLLMSVVQMLFTQFGGAFTSSFGNLSVDGDCLKLREVYYKSSYIMNWIACVCCCIFFCCSSDFIYIVFGENFVLGFGSVLLLAITLTIYLLNIPIISIQNAMGLHRLDAKNMVGQALLAVVLGYVGGKLFGMVGILTGILIPLIIFTFFIKGIIISDHALKLNYKGYLVFIFKELIKISITLTVCGCIVISINISPSIWGLFVKFFIAVLFSLLIPFVLSYKTNEFKGMLQIVNSLIHKRQN